jgi:S-adenosylmethionine decarboxylase proenzyme
MKPGGRHVLLDGSGVAIDLDDAALVTRALEAAAAAAGASIVGHVSHSFQPCGLSVVLLLAESHISIHTFPEARAAFVDIFTCGGCDPERGAEVIRAAFGGTWTSRLADRSVP